ncbi:Hypothetical protein NTJ_02438 [Nesidiocoris tenuis]|uniref:Protein kinase domain-containing protein n=1 Tax=Nesidiocoris tenuis TaxID=355587 RepID=A0ABN7ABD3_9HEMI|nr:Hypothetical protein NTJ_02438 [Nesidiocoris tenuis]
MDLMRSATTSWPLPTGGAEPVREGRDDTSATERADESTNVRLVARRQVQPDAICPTAILPAIVESLLRYDPARRTNVSAR